MIETIEFDIYEDAPEIFLEEVVGPCQYDGSKIIILEFEGDCVGLTHDAATHLLESLQCLLPGERLDAPILPLTLPPERPWWQRYGRGLIYLGLSVLLGMAWYSFFTFTMR